ncbi:hypothetical protein KR067_004397 [Drosophila pandora]|nr:hypothetical protein KR067_004397 [Drosophila pandora]
MKTCDICGIKSHESGDDPFMFGQWKTLSNVTVHYFCLLLSTKLPQRGDDSVGILGFLLTDIRKEIAQARHRKCEYCSKMGANVSCHKCGDLFHMPCAVTNRCTIEFCGNFISYCDTCRPLDDYKAQILKNPPKKQSCVICFETIHSCYLHCVSYGDCCRLGFAHMMCMRKYAMSSGYYLRCPWCRNSKFRDLIRLQSIFVPDRDAAWELEPNAYRDLHRSVFRCDQEECICPKGRQFTNKTWSILMCKFCTVSGVHSKCLVGTQGVDKISDIPKDFKCTICVQIINSRAENLETSLYIRKNGPKSFEGAAADSQEPVFPEDNCVDPGTSNQEFISLTSSSLPLNTPSLPPPAQSDNEKERLWIQKSFNVRGEPFLYLVVYKTDGTKCLGTCTYRFHEDDPRVSDQSFEALELIDVSEEDVWFYHDDCHYWEENKYLESSQQ